MNGNYLHTKHDQMLEHLSLQRSNSSDAIKLLTTGEYLSHDVSASLNRWRCDAYKEVKVVSIDNNMA